MRALLLGLLAIALAACRPGPGAEVRVSAAADASADANANADADAGLDTGSTVVVDVKSDWCVEGMKGLDDDCCYVDPPGATRLLVYLHGIVPPVKDSVQKRTVEGAVLNAATRAPFERSSRTRARSTGR